MAADATVTQHGTHALNSPDLSALLSDALAATRAPGAVVAVVAVASPGSTPLVSAVGVADVSTGAPLHADSVFAGCSTAKTVTSIMVLRLAQEGLVDLDADIREWGIDLPRTPRSGTDTVTLRLLLSHRAGIRDPDGSFAPLGDAEPPTIDNLLAGRSVAHPGPVTVCDRPGERFAYSDAGYAVVEAIVERETGLDIAVAVDQWVAEPLGLRSLALWDGARRPETPARTSKVLGVVRGAAVESHGTDGLPLAGGRAHYPGRAGSCLWTTAGELAQLMADLAPALQGNRGSTLLSPASGRAMTDGGEAGIGLGVFLRGENASHGILTQGWGVGAQCQARVYPGGAVVVMVNGDPGVAQHESGVGLLARRVAAAAGWADPIAAG